MWTDSTIVLRWLHTLEKQPAFVANSVTESLKLMTVDEWNHVATGDNPADAGTCGLSATALFKSSWLKGPNFLRTHIWPFIPCSDVITKMKSNKIAPAPKLMKNETHEMTTLTARVTINALTF